MQPHRPEQVLGHRPCAEKMHASATHISHSELQRETNPRIWIHVARGLCLSQIEGLRAKDSREQVVTPSEGPRRAQNVQERGGNGRLGKSPGTPYKPG